MVTASLQRLVKAIHPLLDESGVAGAIIEVVERSLESLSIASSLVEASLSVDTALGSDLDGLGTLLDIDRLLDETDTAYRTRIKARAVDHPAWFQTTWATEQAVDEVIDESLTVEEYPDVDFEAEFGLVRDEGAFLFRMPLQKIALARDVRLRLNKIKSAGTVAVVDFDYSLFVENFATLVTDYLMIMLETGSETESQFQEPLAVMSDALFFYGTLYYVESLVVDSDDDDFFGELERSLIDSFTAGVTDALGGEIASSFTELLTVMSDALGGEMDLGYQDEINQRVMRIDTGRIDVNVIGGGYISTEEGWDSGSWDSQAWDVEYQVNLGDVF